MGSSCSADNSLQGVSKEVGWFTVGTFWNIPQEWFLGPGVVLDMESGASVTDKTLGLLGVLIVTNGERFPSPCFFLH